MLNLPQKTISKIKKYLIDQQKRLTSEIKSIEADDPVMAPELLAESPESGTESWASDVHHRAVAVKNDLLGLSKKITHSLLSLRKGTYGKCESCGKQIEIQRLEAMPTATVCLACSRKSPKRR